MCNAFHILNGVTHETKLLNSKYHTGTITDMQDKLKSILIKIQLDNSQEIYCGFIAKGKEYQPWNYLKEVINSVGDDSSSIFMNRSVSIEVDNVTLKNGEKISSLCKICDKKFSEDDIYDEYSEENDIYEEFVECEDEDEDNDWNDSLY